MTQIYKHKVFSISFLKILKKNLKKQIIELLIIIKISKFSNINNKIKIYFKNLLFFLPLSLSHTILSIYYK